MNIRETLATRRLWFDGGMGTLLQARGLQPGDSPETWNLTHPDIICDIHKAYLAAGADILKTNTFGANRFKHPDYAELIRAGIRIAKAARDAAGKDAAIAFDMGPLGKMLAPFGDLAFEDAVACFAEQLAPAVECGVDLILIETLSDSYETKAAVLAAKEACDLPIFVTNAYDESGHLLTGADPEAMTALLEGLRVDALGINCSLGPLQMRETVGRLVQAASVPVIVNPNAGLPTGDEAGNSVFSVDPAAFADAMAELIRMGACVVGGCCGTTPEYIARAKAATAALPFSPPVKKHRTTVSSHARAVVFGEKPLLIGERINPTGKPRLKEALRKGEIDYLVGEGIAQEEQGADLLDVNVGLPELDEPSMMVQLLTELQPLTSLPLQIDTSDPATMEAALRIYNGKPLLNSVNGKQESMDAIFPLAAKYGGTLIALTLDEKGIPATAEGRLAVAEKILAEAARYGIPKEDIVIDPLAMAVSADPSGAVETLRALRLIREKTGIFTSLGVSNISFGLPARELLNATFFTLALEAGLNCAILNPFSPAMMQSYHAFLALSGQDANFVGYLAAAKSFPLASAPAAGALNPSAMPLPSENSAAPEENSLSPLAHAIVKGMREQAAALARQSLEVAEPLQVIEGEIIPALDRVGRKFEQKQLYLPQLLLAAEAAQGAFSAVSQRLSASGTPRQGDTVLLATVKGDIHDIGKNIVKVLLANFGFTIVDLGRDVPPETIVQRVKEADIRLVGLSALMTTTVPAMAETIRLLRSAAPETKIMVGGAVLTEEYARTIGADYYAADAMHSVRYAQAVFSQK